MVSPDAWIECLPKLPDQCSSTPTYLIRSFWAEALSIATYTCITEALLRLWLGWFLMKPGLEEIHTLADWVFGYQPFVYTFPNKRERNNTPSSRNVFLWDMDLPKKAIDSMTHWKGRCSIAEMSSSMSRSMDLMSHPHLGRSLSDRFSWNIQTNSQRW